MYPKVYVYRLNGPRPYILWRQARQSKVDHEFHDRTDPTFRQDRDAWTTTTLHRQKNTTKQKGLVSALSIGPYRSLNARRPHNTDYWPLLNHPTHHSTGWCRRYYRLPWKNGDLYSASTGELHRVLNILDLTMKEHRFSGDDPILVFEFKSSMVEECCNLGLNEGQACLELPQFLRGLPRNNVGHQKTTLTPEE